MRIALRVGLLSLLAMLVLGALGSGALAGSNLFDDDFSDCPSSTRLEALAGLQVVRTDEDDELKVEWDTPNPAAWRLSGYTAVITIIVDGPGDPKKQNVSLGTSSVTFDGLTLASDYDVQAAITDRKYVISDIVETEFTSGVMKPSFSTPIYYDATRTPGTTTNDTTGVVTGNDKDDEAKQVGLFYFLGFNVRFDDWYAVAENANPKFRVGLKHGVEKPGDADFDHFRIRVEDEDGDDALGFDAATITDSIYTSRLLFEFNIENEGPRFSETNADYPPGKGKVYFANIRRSNRFDPGQPALYAISNLADSPNTMSGTAADCTTALDGTSALSHATLLAAADVTGDPLTATATIEENLYAGVPDEIYDMPSDIFERDGNYIITAWAEDEDDNQISPKASITLSVRETIDQNGILCLGGNTATPSSGTTSIYALGLTIQDE